MGGSPSKHHSHNSDRNATFSRSQSFPMYGASEVGAASSSVSWHPTEADHVVNDNMPDRVASGSDNHHKRISAKLQPKKEDTASASVVQDEHMSLRKSSLASVSCHATSENRTDIKKLAHLGYSASSSPIRDGIDESRLPLWEKKLRSVKVKPMDNFMSRADSRVSSFRCMESEDGLRALLSPVSTPTRSITASSRLGKFCTAVACNGRLNGESQGDIDFTRSPKSQFADEESSSLSEMEGMGDSEEPGSPLFDPSILATFERAIEASSDEGWQQGSDTSTSSSSRVACSSSDLCSDADSSNWFQERVSITESSLEDETPSTAGNQKLISKSKIVSKSTQTKKDYLDDFEWKCPPGCEDKVVLYFTSLRGVRKTYENCGLVRLILKGYGVHVDERDTWMHSKFREELTHVMGTVLSVPRLFIKGRYIGGAEDVKHLHEDGVLENLLEGFPAEMENTCDVCGGIRFVPCTSCSGSCKMISIYEISRCPDCNENGLILCPSCGL